MQAGLGSSWGVLAMRPTLTEVCLDPPKRRFRRLFYARSVFVSCPEHHEHSKQMLLVMGAGLDRMQEPDQDPWFKIPPK